MLQTEIWVIEDHNYFKTKQFDSVIVMISFLQNFFSLLRFSTEIFHFDEISWIALRIIKSSSNVNFCDFDSEKESFLYGFHHQNPEVPLPSQTEDSPIPMA